MIGEDMCPRCGVNKANGDITISYPSKNNKIYSLCYECANDVRHFLEQRPSYNEHGHNILSCEQGLKADTSRYRSMFCPHCGKLIKVNFIKP